MVVHFCIPLFNEVMLSYGFHVVQQELAAIFKKIGDKQTCAIGLYELYRITQLYPKVTAKMPIGSLQIVADSSS